MSNRVQIWVLTGDKQETAIDVAHTCQLVTRSMHLVTARKRCSEVDFLQLKLNSEVAWESFDEEDEESVKAHVKRAAT